MKEKLKNKKVVYTIFGIIAILLVMIALSYAYWLVTKTQTNDNELLTACLDISISGEKNDIELTNQFPMSDEDGMKLVPYEFTVTNNCNKKTYYQVALEAIGEESNSIIPSALKIALDDSTKLYSSYTKTEPTVSGAYMSKILGLSELSAAGTGGSSITHKLRIWIDEDAPISEMNKTFRSKISVTVGHGIESPYKEGVLSAGDYVNYIPDQATFKIANGYWGLGLDYTTTETTAGHTEFQTETDLKWRVLSIDEYTGEIELIADRQSSTKITFKGETGYNHGVDILNDMCNALYSKTVNGIKVAEGRSVNVEDVNEKSTYDYRTYENYGTLFTINTSDKYYPRLYANELGSTENGLNETNTLLTGSERAEVGIANENNIYEYKKYVGYTIKPTLYATWTHYSYDTEEYLARDLGINNAPSGLIKTGTGFWLASRAVDATNTSARWHLRCINDAGLVGYWHQFNSTAKGYYSLDRPYRPVVALNLNSVTFENSNKKVDGFDYWNLNF